MTIQDILHLLDDLDGYGIIVTEDDKMIIDRLKELGYKE
jgi:hypothetical protein